MSKFYTSVERFGNTILWRGYENGKQFSRKVKFQPTLFTNGKKEVTESKYRSLTTDKPLVPHQLESMKEAKEFV